MLTIIFFWLIIFFTISLIGKLIIKESEWYEYFWLGLIVVISFLQIWSIFFAVNIYSVLIIALVGGFSFFININKIKIKGISKVFIVVSIITLIMVSYYASQPVGWDDTLLYHLNAVKWGKMYAVIPGLANLHSRLGFNSSFFLFSSMLDNLLTDRASHLSLSVISIVLMIEYLWIFINKDDRAVKTFCLFTLPLLIYSIAFRQIIASLSPDFAMMLLVLAVSIQFLSRRKESLLIAILLALTLITVKFSALVFAILAILLIVLRDKSLIKHLLIGSCLIIIPYLVRNIYLSGWILYPLPLFKLNLDWVVPEGSVKTLMTVIQVWARVPGTEWTKFIGAPFWNWFPVWYQNNQNSFEIKMIIFSFLMLLFLFVIEFFKNKNVSESKNLLKLLFISGLSILYVFITAPDIRFGEIFIWTFFASVMSLLYTQIKWTQNVKIITLLGFVLFVMQTSWPFRFDNKPIWKSVRWEQSWPTKNVNGILYPIKDNFCGNSDLPCTPEENNIIMRDKNNLSKGFKVIN